MTSGDLLAFESLARQLALKLAAQSFLRFFPRNVEQRRRGLDGYPNHRAESPHEFGKAGAKAGFDPDYRRVGRVAFVQKDQAARDGPARAALAIGDEERPNANARPPRIGESPSPRPTFYEGINDLPECLFVPCPTSLFNQAEPRIKKLIEAGGRMFRDGVQELRERVAIIEPEDGATIVAESDRHAPTLVFCYFAHALDSFAVDRRAPRPVTTPARGAFVRPIIRRSVPRQRLHDPREHRREDVGFRYSQRPAPAAPSSAPRPSRLRRRRRLDQRLRDPTTIGGRLRRGDAGEAGPVDAGLG
jgi:hypothetical protein